MSSFSCNGPEQLFLYPQPELMAHRRKNAHIPWWDAYLEGEYDLVEVFTGLGIDPEEKCPEYNFESGLRLNAGHTFLELAAYWDKFLTSSTYRIGQLLIKFGANVDANFNTTNQTLLLVAVTRSMSLCVQLLLENGASLTGPDWLGYCPGFHALSFSWLPSAADKKTADLAVKINETLRVLFKHGIDPEWRDNYKGSNLLHHLINIFSEPENLNYDIVDIAKTVVEAGVPFDDANDDGWTPLILAVRRNDHKLTDYFIQKGADVYMKFKHEYLPVELAARHDADKVLNLFLDKGIYNINDRHFNGYTLLHWECLSAKSRSVNLLLRRGADINMMDDSGATPFSRIGLDDDKQKDSIILMLKEFAKASFENNKVCDIDWKLISEHKKIFEIFKSYVKELEKMSNTKFYGSHTYLKVLKMSKMIKKLANLTRNDELVKKFLAGLKLFDFYKDDLKIIFEKAVKLRDESMEVYSRIETIFHEFLPEVVLRNLSDHLVINDLPLTVKTVN